MRSNSNYGKNYLPGHRLRLLLSSATLNPQIGSRRNLQKKEGFATNRQAISKNVFGILILMDFWLSISLKKIKMGIACI